MSVRQVIQRGERYGRLAVVHEEPERTRNGKRRFFCLCDCGVAVVVASDKLRSGHTRSCGCYRRDAGVARGRANRVHGHAGDGNRSPTYRAWRSMIDRCDERHKSAEYYSGRGIRVAPEWLGPGGFERFLAHIGEKPAAHLTLDRVDNDGNYEPGNVRWATPSEQARNRRRPKGAAG